MLDTEVGCAWTRTVAPLDLPLSIEEAKAQARVIADEDTLIDSYIRTATEAAEAFMGRGLLTQTWKLLLDGFANVMPLPMAAPLQSVTSVKYYDDAGAQQTLSTSFYDVDLVSRPGTVVLKPDQSWPSWQSTRLNGSVEIIYVVGWVSPDLVPQRIRQGIAQYVAYLYLDREGMESGALNAKDAAERCWADRIWWSAPQWGC